MEEKGGQREKIWKRTLWVWCPCKPLKYLKTAKALFGLDENTPDLEKLAISLQTRLIPPPARGDGSSAAGLAGGEIFLIANLENHGARK
jgi:hypothetical protein